VDNSNLPPGCVSVSGYSTTTGKPCGVNFPPGCTSSSGYSTTTGFPCAGTSSTSITITNPSKLHDAQVGTNYIEVLGISGVTFPTSFNTNSINWSVSSGILPPGLILTASDLGMIITGIPIGTPTATRTFNFSLTATTRTLSTYGVGFSSTTKQFTLVVNQSIYPPGCTSNTGYSTTTGKPCGNSNQPSITVLSPNGGESYRKGDAVYIKWFLNSQNGISANLGISAVNQTTGESIVLMKPCYQDASYWDTHDYLAADCKNFSPVLNNTFTWIIPFDFVEGKYKIILQVIDRYTKQEITKDESDLSFAVTSITSNQPSITVLSPNGGEIFNQGGVLAGAFTTSNIAYGTFCEVAIVGRKSDGSPVDSTIATLSMLATDRQVFSGTIPTNLVPTGSYKIRVDCGGSALIAQDQSDSSFSITSGTTIQPSITVLSPNGGETFTDGQSINVSWSSVGGNKVEIYLAYPDGVVCYTAPVSSITGNYYFNPKNYTCPNIQKTISSGQFKIALYLHQANEGSEFTDRGVARDFSDSYFTITEPKVSMVPMTDAEIIKAVEAAVRAHTCTSANVLNCDTNFDLDNSGTINTVDETIARAILSITDAKFDVAYKKIIAGVDARMGLSSGIMFESNFDVNRNSAIDTDDRARIIDAIVGDRVYP
jgi:hypothetical protein